MPSSNNLSKSISGIISKRRERLNRQQRSILFYLKSFSIGILALLVFSLSVLTILIGRSYSQITLDLPPIDQLSNLMNFPDAQLLQTTKIYDRTGKHLLFDIKNPAFDNAEYLFLENIPDHLINAIIANNDPGFWNHNGFLFDGTPTLTTKLIEDLLLYSEDKNNPNFKYRTALLSTQATSEFGKEKVVAQKQVA